jgi:polysaccharide export outer membrane protein
LVLRIRVFSGSEEEGKAGMRRRTMRRQVLVLSGFAILLVSALETPAQTAQKAQKANAAAAPTAQGSESKPVATNYVISPGDVLDIQVWKEPEVSKAVPVRPDGKISLPLLDDIQAAGLTASDLGAVVGEKLKKFMSDPQVTVIVTQVNSQHIYVTGEVNHSGTVPLLPGMTALQALSSAGGFTVFANLKKIYILRQENGKQAKYPFNYKEVLKGQNTEEDIVLKPGDTIVVP